MKGDQSDCSENQCWDLPELRGNLLDLELKIVLFCCVSFKLEGKGYVGTYRFQTIVEGQDRCI